MNITATKHITGAKISGSNWQTLYRVAAAAALLVVFVGVLDMAIAMSGGDARENSTITTLEWFTLFQTRPIFAFSNLGFMNLLYQTLAVPLYLALYYIHRKGSQAFAALALILFCVGIVTYFSTNTVFSVFALSRQYAAATTEIQKNALLAAGDAALALGADLTPGVFLGFFFSELGGICMACVLLKDGIFRKVTAWVGILGLSCMVVFNSLAAFSPKSFNMALNFATAGGLLSMAYYILLARRLWQLAQTAEVEND